jgi:hypothetical protein
MIRSFGCKRGASEKRGVPYAFARDGVAGFAARGN